MATDAEVARDGSWRISLYPSLLEKSEVLSAYLVLKEFGHLLYTRASEPMKRRWRYKMALPTEAQLAAVQGKLSSQFKSYREMVESFKTAMDRYVALNIANALISKGVPFAQSHEIKLGQWGATQEYFNRRRYHILVPLVSAYASKEIFEDFGAAFADWYANTSGVTESSVAEALHGIVGEIIESLR